MDAVERWGAALRDWAIPEEILARVAESPWAYPTEVFRSRVERGAGGDPTPTLVRAREALPGGGTVLDVGVGAGAASLPLSPPAARIVGVDRSKAMLTEFLDAARIRRVDAEAVEGGWPDVAPDVEPADVVVCSHVLYNVQDLNPFARALHDHARDRVVVEITATHPLAWMADLWLRFHGLERPTRPTADDAEEALTDLGFAIRRDELVRPPRAGGFASREDAVALVRRRLCLTPDRDPEIAEALGDRLVERDGAWSAGPGVQSLVTLSWDSG
jgi:2-polyprenyl-3-methyl-5-hydroxy-6-metoxy-1,4-benzoquinol methylase